MEQSTRSIPILCSTEVEQRIPWRMFNGTWYGSNEWGSRIPIKVTFLVFKTNDEAMRVGNLLASLDHPSTPRFLAYENSNGTYTVVVERIPSLSIEAWLNKGVGQLCMWTLNQDQSKYLEMTNTYQQVFKGIAKAIRYLHEGGNYHGNLLRGVWVSTGAEIKVTLGNFNTNMGFEEGLRKDINDLLSLVKRAVKKHSDGFMFNGQHPEAPPPLASFFEMCAKLETAGPLESMRELACFIYWSPLFWDWKDRYNFILKLDNFSKGSSDQFFLEFAEDARARNKGTGLGFRDGEPKDKACIAQPVIQFSMFNMRKWQQRVDALPPTDPLYMIYKFNGIPRVYYDSGGIFYFHLNVIKHYGDTCEEMVKQGVALVVQPPFDDFAALQHLLEVFPDAFTAMYERMVYHLYNRSESCFGKNLVAFLKAEPEALG